MERLSILRPGYLRTHVSKGHIVSHHAFQTRGDIQYPRSPCGKCLRHGSLWPIGLQVVSLRNIVRVIPGSTSTIYLIGQRENARRSRAAFPKRRHQPFYDMLRVPG